LSSTKAVPATFGLCLLRRRRYETTRSTTTKRLTMMSKAKARAAAAADKARTALDNGENENPQQLAAPPQLAPPAFGGGPEEDALPAGWEAAVSRSTGETYYINSVTGASQYDRPMADEEDPEEEFGEGSRRESLKARAAQAKAKAAKAASVTKTATKTLSSSDTVGAVRDELREAKHKAQSKAGERAREAADRIQHFKAVLPVLANADDDFLNGIEEDDDGFESQDMDEAQSALEEMSRQVSSRLVDMTELLDEEKELRTEAEQEALILRKELEALWTATRQNQASTASPAAAAPEESHELVVAAPARSAPSPEPELAAPSPASSTTTDEAEQHPEERRTYTPNDEELRDAIVALREETAGMGMGKMRKALQTRRKWAVSEKRLRSMIRSIETGVEVDKTEDERVETVEMLSSTCMELQSTVQRQKKQLQKQRKQIADAREQMIQLQKYADACKAENEMLKGGGAVPSSGAEGLPPPPVSGY
jgi:DNA-binding transcriptional MerR regulator